MSLDELLKRYDVDLSSLPAAPASPADDEVRTRITTRPIQPCAVCGRDSATVRVLTTDYGPRWLDLCWGHGWAVVEPSPRMPTTVEGIFADLRDVIAELEAETGIKASLELWTDGAGWRDEDHG
ncbi:hypothetical protein [Streptomyces sp. NPDC051001]|uniref:hypothetical protein n=1 Tax=Streptomyces sp. NPDC051001 TaxID=3155795 RepID=UPI00343F09E4